MSTALLLWGLLTASAMAQSPSLELVSNRVIARGDSFSPSFSLPPQIARENLCLQFDALLLAEKQAGSGAALEIELNGTPLTDEFLVNKSNVFATENRTLLQWNDGDRWRIVFSPDFDPGRNATAGPHRVLGADPLHFELCVSNSAHLGRNVLMLRNKNTGPQPLVVKNLRLGACACPARPKVEPLAETAWPATPTSPPVAPRCTNEGGVLLSWRGDPWILATEVSIPGGTWRRLGARAVQWRRIKATATSLHASASDVEIRRTVAARSGYVEVQDDFVNRLNVDLGLIVRYRLPVDVREATVYLGAVELPAQPVEIERYEPQSPVAFAITARGSAGLLPGNDVLWVHAESFRDSLGVGLQDPNLCIAPGDSVRLVLRVFVGHELDAWSWLDRARTSLGAQFPIQGGFAFGTFKMSTWPDSVLREWIAVRGLRFISSPTPSSSGGHGLQGPALLQSPRNLESMRQFAAAIHRAAPGVTVLAYFHAQLLNSSAETKAYVASRVLSTSNLPIEYPRPAGAKPLRLYLPERGSQFAADLERLLATFWELGYDGIYWDEMSYSFRPWTYSRTWDGASGDVDRNSHLLLRRKSAVPLIVQPWVEDRLGDLVARGKLLVANTEPVTMTMHNYEFPRFVETSNAIAAKASLLWTPIGLGDRARERTAADVAVRVRDHLENGILYYYYSPVVEIRRPSVTAHMFPITVQSIRSGTILGKERILTTRSGRFGWKDRSRHEVHVFDARGYEIAPVARRLDMDNITWTELEVPPGGTAAILRLPPAE